MLVLALESSCDETAAAVVADGQRILSSVVYSQSDLHEEYAGVVPELASRAHAERILPVLRESLARAGIGLGLIDAIAVGNRPGLIGSLLVGVAAAKALAWSLSRPLVGVDHVHAHLYAGVLQWPDDSPLEPQPPAPDPLFPALGLVVSGGHTSLYELDSWLSLRRLGATIDDAMGEAFDKAGVILGLPYPGGPNIDRLASEHGADDHAFDFPVSRLARDSLDFSFSGLKTALLYAVEGVPGERAEPPPPLTPERRRNLAASFQRAACAAAILKIERAIDAAQRRGMRYKALLTGGGVTANSRLRLELAQLAARRALPLVIPPPPLCVDNAAMIAGLAHARLDAGQSDDLSLQATPTCAL